MGKIEHKTRFGLCSSFASAETHLTFREVTCSKKDHYQIPESTGNRCSSLCHWGDVQGCGCVVRLWGKDLEFLPLSQPVSENSTYLTGFLRLDLLTFKNNADGLWKVLQKCIVLLSEG